HRADAGGRSPSAQSPRPPSGDTAAWQSKVACVYQKSMVVPRSDRRREPLPQPVRRERPLDQLGGKAAQTGRAAARAYGGVQVDPNTRARDLAVEQRQFVEIARALSFGARLIVLDEPTAQLDARGASPASSTSSANSRAGGVAFLFISHHLQEVYELCTAVTVYRDARHVLTAPVA
ncbi:ATP-binding cassette domain-containing protein, partial [Streptomyces sp. SID7803]|nr:ATP-binding cassette domain-containing protein [Streptomyces sp. SID7803]